MTYRITVNMPGCLPEMDPYEVDTLEEAREALITEVGYSLEGDWGGGFPLCSIGDGCLWTEANGYVHIIEEVRS